MTRPRIVSLDSSTVDAGNVSFAPHTAWATTGARHRLLDGVRRNLAAFLAGEEPPDAVA